MSHKLHHKVFAALVSLVLVLVMALGPAAFAADESPAPPAAGEALESGGGSEPTPPQDDPVEPGAVLSDGSVYLVSDSISNEAFASLGVEVELDSSANATFEGSFYSKLTARQKACYNALQNISCEQFYSDSGNGVPIKVSGINGTRLSGNISGGRFYPTGAGKITYDKISSDMFVGWAALCYDRPDLIWIQNAINIYFTFSGRNGSATITNAYYQIDKTLGRQASTLRSQSISAAKSIASAASRQGDTYSKVKYVHDLLATYSTYQHYSPSSYSERLSHNAYSALIPNDSYNPVCEGYAKAFKMVLDEMRIPCVLVSSKTHMWNAVKMDDGLWYIVDLTWDDGSDTPNWDYFLIGMNTVVHGETFSRQEAHVDQSPFVGQNMNQPGNFYPKRASEAYKQYEGGGDWPALRYSDVTRDTFFYSAVETVSDLGYFAGTNGKFNPYSYMTRGQFALVMAKAMGADLGAYKNIRAFSDVNPTAWYGPAAAWAKANRVMSGSNGKFNPNKPITRQEMCVTMANALRLPDDGTGWFEDDSSIASWAKSKVYACQQAKLISGDNKGNFNPNSSATRGQAAVIFAAISRLLQTY